MIRLRWRRWLAFGLLLGLLGGCAHDKKIVLAPTSNILHPCDKGYTLFAGYFGQYYVSGNGCNGGGQEQGYAFNGAPRGAIAFRWKAIYYDPVKGKKALDERKYRYFYAESCEPVEMPPRGNDHWLYEIHISLGPRRVSVKEAIVDQDVQVIAYHGDYGRTEYQVGRIDTLYYFVRSRPRTWSRDWPLIKQAPYHFQAIKGIELTKAQYWTIACEQVGTANCDKRLEDDAPGLTSAQLAYLRAVRGEGK